MEPKNKYPLSFRQRLQNRLFRFRYGNRVLTDGTVRFLGGLPHVKLPPDARLRLGHKVVLNSDLKNSNTALTYKCKLTCGLHGVIEIGDNSMLNGVSVTAYESVIIGKNCQIASATFISDTDFHPTDPSLREKQVLGHKIDFAQVAKKPVVIGDNVWIGWGCIILKGVHIGDNSIIAAGSVVLSDIPANSLATGNPATVKKTYSSKE